MKDKKKSKFKGRVGADSQRQQKAATSYGHLLLPKGVSVFSPKPGSKGVMLDIIPYIVTNPKHPDKDEVNDIATVGQQWYKLPYKIHREVGVAKDTVVCPTTFGKKCPICEHQALRRKEGATKEELKSLYASKRNLYVVVPLNSKEHQQEPHIFDISQHLFQDLLNDEIEEHEEFEVFPDLEEGFSLKIRFSSETIGNSKPFAEAKKIEFVEREEQYEADFINEIPDLDKVLKVLSYEELSALFFEEEEPDGGRLKDADDDDEEDRHKKHKSGKKKEEEDDDDDDERSKKHKSSSEGQIFIADWDDLQALSLKEMKKYAKINKLDLDIEDEEDEDEWRKAIAEVRDIHPPKSSKKAKKEEDDDNDDDDEKPVRRKTESSIKRKSKKEEEDDDDDDDEKPVRGKSSKKEESTGKKGKCPYGHRFGKDTNDFDECDDCPLWDDCIEEKEK